MRVTFDDKENTAWFIQDLPEGGMELECHGCGTRFISGKEDMIERDGFLHSNNDSVITCSSCKKEIFYPGWASW